MSSWLPSALLSLFSFGLWGFFSKLALQHIDPKSTLIYETIGVIVIGFIALWLLDFKTEVNVKGLSFGVLTGFAYGVGCLFYLIAADRGKITTVVTLTALYPVVTIILSHFLLRETVSMKQYAGIVCGLLAIYLMAG